MNETIQPGGPSKGLVERAKAIVVTPKTEWPAIAGEGDSVQSVFLKYAVPLAAIGPVASFIGGQVFGYRAFLVSYQPSVSGGLATAITSYVLNLAALFLLAWIANFLAPKFGGRDSYASAFKWCVYSATAAWVVAVVGLVPSLWILSVLGLYSLYLLYLGAAPMMAVPQDKAAGYVAVTVFSAAVVYIVAAAVAGSLATSLVPTSTLIGSDDVEVTVPGYGQVSVTDNGDTQSVEVPGMGTVKVSEDGSRSTVEMPGGATMEVTQDGDTVRIEGDNFKAEVKDPDAAR